MLNALRRSARTWVAKVLIGLLVLSFAIWGISDVVTGFGANEVAEAGDTAIEALDFQRAYQRRVQAMSQQMGRGITPAQAEAFGIPGQVLGELVTDALILDEADGLGIGVSDELLAREVRENPAFAGPDGNFDRFLFERVLSSNGFTEETFLETERELIARQQVVDGIVGGLRAPEAYLRAVNVFQSEERTARWMRLTDDAIGPIADPTPTELSTFFEDNRDRFRAPEYRAFDLLELDPEAIADPAAISEEAARAEYDRSGAFGQPERRRVLQIVFDDADGVAAAEAREAVVEDGEPFSDVVARLERSMADVDLGLVEAADIIDPAVREAAFSMAAGETRLVDGRFGPVLVRVAEVEAARKRPFEAVADDIRRELAVDRAAAEVNDLYDAIEDAFAGGSTVAEVGARFGLPVRTVEAVDRQGRTPDGTRLELPADGELLPEVFDTDVGIENAPIRTGRDSYVWYRVTDVIPARNRELSEVEGEVILAWTEQRKASALEEVAAEAARRVRAGEPMEAVAGAYPGVSVNETGAFSRLDMSGAGELPEVAAAAAFEGPQGHVANVATDAGDRIVLKVTGVTAPAFFRGDATLVAVEEELNRAIGDTLLTEYVNQLQTEKGVTVNRALLDQIVGAGG